MLWSIDSCQNRVSADHYYLTVPRAQVSTRQGLVFFEVICWQITSFKWSQAQVYFFQWFKYVVFMSLWPRTVRIVISNWPRTRKFSQFFWKCRRGVEDLFLPWSPVGHALRPIFMLWLVKIWQVSLCEKFMHYLENCSLWQLKLTEFCVNLWCF